MNLPPRPPTGPVSEPESLVNALGERRWFLRNTLNGLTDAQAGHRSTPSALCLGGIVKHVTHAESSWAEFLRGGSAATSDGIDREETWRMLPSDTVESVLDHYARIASATDELIGTLDLDRSIPLPEAPWFPPGSQWTARRVVLHIIGETAHHCGHADIIREAIDGQRSMG